MGILVIICVSYMSGGQIVTQRSKVWQIGDDKIKRGKSVSTEVKGGKKSNSPKKNHVSSNNTVQDNRPCKYWLLLGDGGAKCHTGYPENFAAPEVAQPE